MTEIPKAYNPQAVEDKWIKFWADNKLYHSEVDNSKTPYTIIIPPPNITGILTLGHVLNNSIQDVYIRYKRMKGFNACWIPGTDHASIATEAKVVGFLKEKGIDKFEIGREEFLKHCWEWKEKYGGLITQQLRKLGISCDWERERFTMDEHYSSKVIEAFVKLYKKGLIYRGYRMVNWCPVSKSAISDEEVIYQTQQGKLWYFKYPVKDSNEFMIVATTRPETMLGDTGVAVNPNDERFKHLIGKKVILPIVGREIPIFADSYVDVEFGTGAVKVTPAHDFNDYEMAKRHKLELINIFTEEARTNENVPKELQGLDRFVVREKVIEKFQEFGLLEKIESYTNNIGYSQRGNVPIEPYLSEQWFMKMDELVRPAIKVVEENQVNFHPEHWTKTYFHWMSNIKDWCISRQLWWGHRIPVWYNKTTNEIHCEVEPPKDIENWNQEEDVLDTWASSWLWAQDVFTNDKDQNYYYPTDLLVTGPDIIFFWVARMIIAGMEFHKKIPFKDVYFTSIIRDMQGRKLSKSLGNSPDPFNVIAEYGADALRFTINYISPLGQDVMFSTDKCEIGRNFANKIWNAGRFLLMNAEKIKINDELKNKHIDAVDEWLDSKFNRTLKQIDFALDTFDLNGATKLVYSYVWSDFCDWYIEFIKNKLYSNDEELKSASLTRALEHFENLLKIVHPFMPFITEEIWHLIKTRNEKESISTSQFPILNELKINEKIENEIEFLKDVITALRTIRSEMNLAPSAKITAFLKTNQISIQQEKFIKSLARFEKLVVDPNIEKPKGSASSIVRGCDIFVPLEGLIDIEIERNRIEKEIKRLEGMLIGVEKKLANEDFVKRAPKEIIEKEQQKKEHWNESLQKLNFILNDLK